MIGSESTFYQQSALCFAPNVGEYDCINCVINNIFKGWLLGNLWHAMMHEYPLYVICTCTKSCICHMKQLLIESAESAIYRHPHSTL